MEVAMREGPKKRQAKKMIGFRAPPDLVEWVDGKTNVKAGIGRTEALTWAVTLARDYYEAAKAFDARLKAFAKTNDLTELGALKRVIEAGLDALEKKR